MFSPISAGKVSTYLPAHSKYFLPRCHATLCIFYRSIQPTCTNKNIFLCRCLISNNVRFVRELYKARNCSNNPRICSLDQATNINSIRRKRKRRRTTFSSRFAKSATNRIATKEAVELTSNVDSILENNRFVGGASCASEEKRCGS